MKNSIKILVLLIVFIICFAVTEYNSIKEPVNVVSNEIENLDSGDLFEEEDKGEKNSEDVTEKEHEDEKSMTEISENKEENVTTKLLSSEKINSLKNAEMPDYSQNKKMELLALKPSKEETMNLSGKDIKLNMNLKSYSPDLIEGNTSFSYSYYIDVKEKQQNKGILFLQGKVKESIPYQEDIENIDSKPLIDKIEIKYGKLKDTITDKEYLVFYGNGEEFYSKVFYLYDENGLLCYKGLYDGYFGNAIPIDTPEKYKYLAPIEFYENKIVYYDQYTKFEDGEKISIEKEIADTGINTNKVHEVIIENGVLKDKIIKIYDINAGQLI